MPGIPVASAVPQGDPHPMEFARHAVHPDHAAFAVLRGQPLPFRAAAGEDAGAEGEKRDDRRPCPRGRKRPQHGQRAPDGDERAASQRRHRAGHAPDEDTPGKRRTFRT